MAAIKCIYDDFHHDTHQVLAYADDVNLIGDDIRTIERNAYVLLMLVRILV